MARKLGATVIGHTPALQVIEEAAAWSGGVLRESDGLPMAFPGVHRRRVRHGRQAGDVRGRDARAEGARHAREGRRARSHVVGGHAAVLQGDLDGRLERVRVRGGRRRAQARHRPLPRSRRRAAASISPACSRTRSRLDDWRDAFTTLATQDDTGAIKVAFDFRGTDAGTSDDVVLVDIADRVAVDHAEPARAAQRAEPRRAQGAAGRDRRAATPTTTST